jgi:hypothetical protein
LAAQAEPLPPPSSLDVQLAQLSWERSGLVVSRAAAMRNSVINRARDLLTGTLGSLPLVRANADGDVLDPAWLTRPDPDHTLGWLVAWTADDLFFYGYAWWRVTARDTNTPPRPVAVQWMPVVQTAVMRDPFGRIISATWTPPWGGPAIDVPARDIIAFEGLSTGILDGGRDVLSTAVRLDNAANRYSGENLAAGWLKQTAGVDLSPTEAAQRLEAFSLARQANVLAWLGQTVEYHESQLNPSVLQLVEGRTYQDGAVARLTNLPAYLLGVSIPGDSFTYKTALSTRVDFITFGLAPYLTVFAQTLSGDQVTPRGQTVAFDLSDFLALAASVPTAPVAPTPQGA